MTNLQHLDIETMIASLPKEECIEYITEKLDLTDPYVIFRKAVFEGEYELAKEICAIDQIRDLLDVCNESKQIEERITHLRKIEGKDAAIAIMGMKYFLATVELEQYPDLILKISTVLVVNNIYTSLFIPLKKLQILLMNQREILEVTFVVQSYIMYILHIMQRKDWMIWGLFVKISLDTRI